MNINERTLVAPNLGGGEEEWARAETRSGAVTDEQRSHRPNSAQPAGRQVFFAQTSLLAPYRSTVGYARRSRLVWAKNPWPRTSSNSCSRPLRSPQDRRQRQGRRRRFVFSLHDFNLVLRQVVQVIDQPVYLRVGGGDLASDGGFLLWRYGSG